MSSEKGAESEAESAPFSMFKLLLAFFAMLFTCQIMLVSVGMNWMADTSAKGKPNSLPECTESNSSLAVIPTDDDYLFFVGREFDNQSWLVVTIAEHTTLFAFGLFVVIKFYIKDIGMNDWFFTLGEWVFLKMVFAISIAVFVGLLKSYAPPHLKFFIMLANYCFEISLITDHRRDSMQCEDITKVLPV